MPCYDYSRERERQGNSITFTSSCSLLVFIDCDTFFSWFWLFTLFLPQNNIVCLSCLSFWCQFSGRWCLSSVFLTLSLFSLLGFLPLLFRYLLSKWFSVGIFSSNHPWIRRKIRDDESWLHFKLNSIHQLKFPCINFSQLFFQEKLPWSSSMISSWPLIAFTLVLYDFSVHFKMERERERPKGTEMIMDQDFSLTPSLVIYLTVKWNWKNTQRHHHQWIWYKMEWTLESSKFCRKNKKRKKHNVMKVEWVLVIHCYCFFHEACFSGDQESIWVDLLRHLFIHFPQHELDW